MIEIKCEKCGNKSLKRFEEGDKVIYQCLDCGHSWTEDEWWEMYQEMCDPRVNEWI